jgi:hypothetical protein
MANNDGNQQHPTFLFFHKSSNSSNNAGNSNTDSATIYVPSTSTAMAHQSALATNLAGTSSQAQAQQPGTSATAAGHPGKKFKYLNLLVLIKK